jgi:thiol-disulfide isomerase/thioredoxin
LGIVVAVDVTRSQSLRRCFALALCCACAAAPPAPTRSPYDLVLPRVGGGRYDLAQLKGQVVLVYFFSTWCLPCLAELKVLATLQDEQGKKGFAVVAIGMDLEGSTVLEPFAESMQLPFPVLLADSFVRSGETAYGPVREVPTTVLLDRTGSAVAAYGGPADPLGLQQTIARLVK